MPQFIAPVVAAFTVTVSTAAALTAVQALVFSAAADVRIDRARTALQGRR